MNLIVKVLSSMEKVFPKAEPQALQQPMTALAGEAYSFQIAVKPDSPETHGYESTFEVRSDLPLTVRQIGYVPARVLYYSNEDHRYFPGDPGIFPDPMYLSDGKDGTAFPVISSQWNSFFIEVRPTADTPPGHYPIRTVFTLRDMNGKFLSSVSKDVSLEVIGAALPHQTLKYTCWFHGDCLADYYHIPVFSEEHWKAMENAVRLAAQHGQNMLLTPIFTPPLDTEVGGERTTIQLIGVARTGGEYTFDFSNLDRYLDMARRCGIEYFEISHLFTQWGGRACPKVMATVDGEYRRLFGWENEALSPEYKAFLSRLLPELAAHLKAKGAGNCTYFHLTDEPGKEVLAQYQALKTFVQPLVEGFPILDAMSEYDYFEKGVSQYPVVATYATRPFLEKKRPEEFWVYYCGAGTDNYSNRALDMPGYRTRILGIQLYLNRCSGFLQWGLNFYNTSLSRRHINPYLVTDAGGNFAAGDSFIIYPGEDYTAVPSQRLVIFGDGLQDCRALQLLESLTSREHVEALIQEGAQDPISFTSYPEGEGYILDLRERVNREIGEKLS